MQNELESLMRTYCNRSVSNDVGIVLASVLKEESHWEGTGDTCGEIRLANPVQDLNEFFFVVPSLYSRSADSNHYGLHLSRTNNSINPTCARG